MSLFKVRVLYDFQGEPNTAEISVAAGEVLNVTRVDVGEGWWEGVNSKGKSGLFPEAYVEKIDAGPPNIPPPAPPTQQGIGESHDPEDWDDDWDDDTYSEIANNGSSNNIPARNQNTHSIYSNEGNEQQFSISRQAGDNVSLSGSTVGGGVDNKGTITKKSLNIFSSYAKSGLEGYMLGTSSNFPQASKKIHIYRDNDEIIGRWEILSNPYTVTINSPKKASKMGGLKSFIAYQLTPSFTNNEVFRRYKHFDWLHDRLVEKFNLVAIPPLPDKQVSNRYEEAFIEHRRMQLQEFINYMCRHPVLSICDVWIHFLTCTDEKQWKIGKRNAEKDQLKGANFCLAIEAPEKEIMPSLVETKIEDNISYLSNMDQCIKNLMHTAQDQQKKCSSMYKREFTKMGETFFALGSAFEFNQGIFSKSSSDVKSIGTAFMQIGMLYESQAKIDWQPLFDKLYICKGITSSLPDILNMQKMSEQKKKEWERNSQGQQVVLADVRRRADVVTYAVFAELNHFQHERDNALKNSLKDFLKEQLNFYKNVVSKLEDTLNNFD